MLAHSRHGEVRLLPALPSAPRTGRVSGLRLRGGVELAMAWQDRKMIETTLTATSAQQLSVHCNGAVHTISLTPGTTGKGGGQKGGIRLWGVPEED